MQRRLSPVLVIFLVAFATPRSAHSQTSASTLNSLSKPPLDRVISLIDDQRRIILAGNRHPLATMENDIGAVSPDRRLEKMILLFRPDAQQQTDLDSLTIAQQDPTSPYYHQWLTPESYASHFGISGNDKNRTLAWLISHGFEIDEVATGERSILFTGTVAQVEEAFHTQIHSYIWKHETHYANTSNPEIPAALSGIVDGVVSLHDFQTQPLHTGAINLSPESLDSAHSLTPADFAAIYNLAPLYASGINGAGQSIAIAGRTTIDLRDVQQFRVLYGLPVIDPEIFIDGVDPGRLGKEEEAEALLDVEWAGAVARNASIKYVVSKSTSATDGIFLAALYIVNHNLAPVMSLNFGLCEAALGASANRFVNYLWQQAAVQGITVVVPSGNSGAAACDDPSTMKAEGTEAVNGLASTPYNTAVGGTEFDDTANPSLYWTASNGSATQGYALRYIPEKVWNESGASGLYSSGGGVSTLYSKPWWQSEQGTFTGKSRDLPDVALSAATHDGYRIQLHGAPMVVGGTSAAAASFAGLMALLIQSAGARQGNAASMLYALANRSQLAGEAAFHDIIAGNNSVPGVTGYSAAAGYNLATGLGSVDAEFLADGWSSHALTSTGMGGTGTMAGESPELATRIESAAKTSPVAATLMPVLYYSAFESGPATGGGSNYACVYGENFGVTRGSSKLSVDGVEITLYRSWADYGKPYGPGHYAEACGDLGKRIPSSSARVQIMTVHGSSNTAALATGQGAFGASGIGH